MCTSNELSNWYYIPFTNRVFFPSIYGLRSHLGHKSKGNKLGSVTYRTDGENEVSKIFILYCVSDGLRNDFYSH